MRNFRLICATISVVSRRVNILRLHPPEPEEHILVEILRLRTTRRSYSARRRRIRYNPPPTTVAATIPKAVEMPGFFTETPTK